MQLPPSLLELAPPVEKGFVDINLVRMRQRGMVTHESGRTSVAEDFRIIKRHLLNDARQAGPLLQHRGPGQRAGAGEG